MRLDGLCQKSSAEKIVELKHGPSTSLKTFAQVNDIMQVRAQPRKSEMDFNRKWLDMLGLWPLDSDFSRSNSLWRRVLPVTMLVRAFYIMAIEAVSIAHVRHDTSAVVEFSIIIIFYIHFLVKYSCMFFKRERMSTLFTRVEELSLALVAVQRSNVAILRSTDLECYRVNRYPTVATFGMIAVALLVLALYSLTTREIPFFEWFPYDSKASLVFEATMMFIVTGFIVDLVAVVLCDAACVIPILQIAGQLSMLSSDIENAKFITEDDSRPACRRFRERRDFPTSNRVQSKVCWTDHCFGRVIQVRPQRDQVEVTATTRGVTLKQCRMEELMKINISHHQQIIDLVREVQSLFNPILAEQIMFNGLLGLVGLYVSTMNKTTFVKSVVMSTCILGGIIELLFMCWACDKITIESGRVFVATYACDWLDESTAFKRSLRLLMTRAQKNLVLKAAGISISRRTFRTMCKVAYYFQSLLDRIYSQS